MFKKIFLSLSALAALLISLSFWWLFYRYIKLDFTTPLDLLRSAVIIFFPVASTIIFVVLAGSVLSPKFFPLARLWLQLVFVAFMANYGLVVAIRYLSRAASTCYTAVQVTTSTQCLSIVHDSSPTARVYKPPIDSTNSHYGYPSSYVCNKDLNPPDGTKIIPNSHVNASNILDLGHLKDVYWVGIICAAVPTTTPTPTLTPTPTSAPALNLSVSLQGVASPSRPVSATLYLRQNNTDAIPPRVIALTPSAASFTAAVAGLPSGGPFQVLLQAPGYLRKTIGTVTLPTTVPLIAPAPLKFGDFDDNNDLNLLDLSNLLSKYTSSSVPLSGTNLKYDGNHSQTLTLGDISLALTNYLSLHVLGD